MSQGSESEGTGMNNLMMTTEQADELQLVETEDEELMMEG